MTDYPLDIIMPVWNSPVAVRAALAAFAEDSPSARLVMVNNGSERETEAILHEFAEALDDRALLIATGKNIGTVAALNLGIVRSSAPFALVTNPFVRLSPGWFEPVLSLFDRIGSAGAVCLRSLQGADIEADYGSFAAMVLRRDLFLSTGGFDEQLDGSVWALRDFARKATAGGYLTLSHGNRQLRFEEQQVFGAAARREQLVKAAKQLYVERWGEPSTFMIICADEIPGEGTAHFRETLLSAARQGDCVRVAATNKTGKLLVQEGFSALHENIAIQVLPRFFSDRALRHAVDKLVREDVGAVLIAETDTASYPLRTLSFADFTARLSARRERFYRGGVHA